MKYKCKPYGEKTARRLDALQSALYGCVQVALFHSKSKDENAAAFAKAIVRAVGVGKRVNRGIGQARIYLAFYNGATINRRHGDALAALDKAWKECKRGHDRLRMVIQLANDELPPELEDVYRLVHSIASVYRRTILKLLRKAGTEPGVPR
jgi:hypothetical protein